MEATETLVQPLANRVIVRVHDAEEKTPGGIILPETAQEKPAHGTVLAIGPGARTPNGDLIPVDLEVGDVVFFARYAGQEIVLEEGNRHVMGEHEILVKIPKEATE